MTVLNLRRREEQEWRLVAGSMIRRIAAAIRHGETHGYRVTRVRLRDWAAMIVYLEHLERGGETLPFNDSATLFVHGVPVILPAVLL